MAKVKRKNLKVYKDGKWKYVFGVDKNSGLVVVTSDINQALEGTKENLEYYYNKFSKLTFISDSH